MTRTGIIRSRRPCRDRGAVCESVYDLTRQCTDARVDRHGCRLRQRGGLVELIPVRRGPCISPPAPSVRARVDPPTRGRRAVVVDGEDVLVPARDVVTLAKVDERGGRCR